MSSLQKISEQYALPIEKVTDLFHESVESFLKFSNTTRRNASTQTEDIQEEEEVKDNDTTVVTQPEPPPSEFEQVLNECTEYFPVLSENSTVKCKFNYINELLFSRTRELDHTFCKEQFWYDTDRLLKSERMMETCTKKLNVTETVVHLLCRLGCRCAELIEKEKSSSYTK